jgi:hypothetical protein
VHALIQLRMDMDNRYQENGPKGPLWEEISGGMRKLGYNRNSKRCKEKWENINKYFKKVKESSKKRPEDSKTCPYFHQLDALYRTKALASSSSGALHAPAPSPRAEAAAVTTVLAPVPLSSQTPPAPQHVEHTGKTFTNGNGNNGCASNGAGMQVKTSNGAGIGARLLTSIEGAGHGGNNGTVTNKPVRSLYLVPAGCIYIRDIVDAIRSDQCHGYNFEGTEAARRNNERDDDDHGAAGDSHEPQLRRCRQRQKGRLRHGQRQHGRR